MRGKATRPKTYTFRVQDVYVSRSKRIRFRCKTYTFYSRYVYVATKKGIRSTEKPYALGDRRMEAGGGKGELIMGKTYSILGKDEGEGITVLGQLAWIEGEGGA